MKKILSGILVMSVIFGAGAIPTAYNADYVITAKATGTYGSLSYESDGESITITAFDNSVREVEIPDSIEDIPVKAIGDEVFRNAVNLNSVKIPDSVTSIGNYGFYNCQSLTNIDLPAKLETIGESAFSNCKRLEKVEIPESITSMGKFAFSGCTLLQEINFPGSLLTIPNAMCMDCISLSYVNLGSGVEYVDSQAFSGCTKLTELYVPLTVKSFYVYSPNHQYDSFADCTALTDIYYEGADIQWRLISNISLFNGATIHYGADEIPKPLNPDLNRDGVIDASDASVILAYYAYQQTGGSDSIEEFVAK